MLPRLPLDALAKVRDLAAALGLRVRFRVQGSGFRVVEFEGTVVPRFVLRVCFDFFPWAGAGGRGRGGGSVGYLRG